jgi:predicted ATP-binding protein involved in virulence
MNFKEGEEAGWHVILGNNGSGKSTIVKSIAAVLVGYDEIDYTQQNWVEWLNQNSIDGKIGLFISSNVNKNLEPYEKQKHSFTLKRDKNGRIRLSHLGSETRKKNIESEKQLGYIIYGFSCSFGTYRRLNGGNERWKKVYESAPRAAAHLSIFSEDVALTESLTWLKELEFKRLKEKELNDKNNTSSSIFKHIKSFINTSELLPFGVQFEEIDIEGEPIFKDGYGNKVKVTQLSDGFRSILSLTFELIRQMINSFGVDEVFKNNPIISIHGVVLIDEVDTHLHPTWQTKIGKWFTKHFPNIQFIVTTHSPLICRACDNGTIWKLPDPNKGENQNIQQIVGHEKDLLVFGDILDAYDTDVFGENITRGEAGKEKHKIYRDLMRKKRYNINMTQDEQKELEHLKTIFQSNVETE